MHRNQIEQIEAEADRLRTEFAKNSVNALTVLSVTLGEKYDDVAHIYWSRIQAAAVVTNA